MVTVIVEDGNLEKALRKFRKEVDKEEILAEYKERQYFEKPSTKEHHKKVSMQRRNERVAESERKSR